jgi:hypothetical protein
MSTQLRVALPPGYAIYLEAKDLHGRHSDPEIYEAFVALYHGSDFIDSCGVDAAGRHTQEVAIAELASQAFAGEQTPWVRST